MTEFISARLDSDLRGILRRYSVRELYEESLRAQQPVYAVLDRTCPNGSFLIGKPTVQSHAAYECETLMIAAIVERMGRADG